MGDIDLNLKSDQAKRELEKLYKMFDRLAVSVDKAQRKMERVVLARPEEALRAVDNKTRAMKKAYQDLKRIDTQARTRSGLSAAQDKTELAGLREGSLSSRMGKVSAAMEEEAYGTERYKMLSGELKNLNKEFDKTHSKVGKARQAFLRAGRAIGNFTIFVAAALFVITGFVSIMKLTKDLLVDFFKAGSDVTKALNEIAVSFNMTSKQAEKFAEISEKSRESTGSSQQDVNKAFEELMNRGLSANEALKKLDHTLKLARHSKIDVAMAAKIATTSMKDLNDQFSKMEKYTDPSALASWNRFVETFKTFSKEFYKQTEPEIIKVLENLTDFIKRNGQTVISFFKDYVSGINQMFLLWENFKKNQFGWDDKKGAPKLENEINNTSKNTIGAGSSDQSLNSLKLQIGYDERIKIYKDLYKQLGYINKGWRADEDKELTVFYSKVRRLEGDDIATKIKNHKEYVRLWQDREKQMTDYKQMFKLTGRMPKQYMEWSLEQRMGKIGLMTKPTDPDALKDWEDYIARAKRITARGVITESFAKDLEGQKEFFEKSGVATEKYIEIQTGEFRRMADNAVDIWGFTEKEAESYYQRLMQTFRDELAEPQIKLYEELYDTTGRMDSSLYDLKKQSLDRYYDYYVKVTGNITAAEEILNRRREEFEIKKLEDSSSALDGVSAAYLKLTHKSETMAHKMSSVWEAAAKDMNQTMKTYFFDFMENRFNSLGDVAASVLRTIQRGINEMLYQYMMFGSSGKGGMASFLGKLGVAAVSAYSGATYYGDQAAAGAIAEWGSTNFQHGGSIYEHIIGRGLKSGRYYQFGEAGPEDIVPKGIGASGDVHITIQAIDSKSFQEVCQRNAHAVLVSTQKALEKNPAARKPIKRLLK